MVLQEDQGQSPLLHHLFFDVSAMITHVSDLGQLFMISFALLDDKCAIQMLPIQITN